MTISQVGSLVNSTASPLVFGATPTNGDLILLCAHSTAVVTPPAGFTQSVAGGANPYAAIFAKIASSETNSYAYSGLSGTGAAVNGMVFHATNGWDATLTALATSSGSATCDPAGVPSKASSLLVSSMRNSGASTGATATWNAGSPTTPANATGRGGADFIILTSVPADAKVVWSLGTETVLVNFTEASTAVNAGFFPM